VSEAAVSFCKTSETSMQWLALALTPGLGPTKARRVIEFFGSVQALFRASLTELEAAGLRAVSAQSLGTGRSMELAQDELGKAAAADARIVALDDPGYPTRLKQIYDPPLILYVRGNEAVISQPGIALVGTRHPTPYGSGMSERLACDLAARGLVIFSGMARGIDTAGHRGPLRRRVKPWQCGVPASTLCIPRRTRDWWNRFSL
jgi:DNA processing protein